jgi:hypothetical protein
MSMSWRRSNPVLLLFLTVIAFYMLSLLIETLNARTAAFIARDNFTAASLNSRADDCHILFEFFFASLLSLSLIYIVETYSGLGYPSVLRKMLCALFGVSILTGVSLYGLASLWEGNLHTLSDDIYLSATFPPLVSVADAYLAASFFLVVLAGMFMRRVPLYYVIRTKEELEELALEKRSQLLTRAASLAKARGRPEEITERDVADAENEIMADNQ